MYSSNAMQQVIVAISIPMYGEWEKSIEVTFLRIVFTSYINFNMSQSNVYV